MDGVPYPGMENYPGMQQQHAIEFMTIKEATSVFGFFWLIEWSTTSIYIKSKNRAMQAAKVSLHGPDPRPEHAGKQCLKFGLDKNELVSRAEKFGGRWSPELEQGPFYFHGRQVNDHAAHIIRFTQHHDAYLEGAPCAKFTEPPKQKSTFRGLVHAPDEHDVVHIDIYLSLADPYWPGDRDTVNASQSGFGPITNEVGMNLTAVVHNRSDTFEPDPFGDLRGDTPLDQCDRGIAAICDETGLLWMCEKLMSPAP